MGVLAVYDTVGIQNYVFASNKLSENVGASKLVADVFAEGKPYPNGTKGGVRSLPSIIKAYESRYVDWRNRQTLETDWQADILYQGGGNAYVAFANPEIFQKITKEFLISTQQEVPGIGIAVAAIETDFQDTYQSDMKKLNQRLMAIKGGFNIPVFAGSQPITKQSVRTGLPVSDFKHGEFLSIDQMKKRKRYELYKEKEPKISNIKEFDDLAYDRGSDSLIAIIHADGNNMGKRIKAYMGSYKDYSSAVPAIRHLSVQIDACYEKARYNTISAFQKGYTDYLASHPKDSNSKELPILKLIGDGDDTTLVMGGRFAIDFAARLLREIEKQPDPFGGGAAPTACAGVVLFHSHYPFSQAYQLAEALCASAKKLSRHKDKEGSYLDYHLHQSGSVSGLHTLREEQYRVDGLSILRRPWRISPGFEAEIPNFQWIEDHIARIAKMPRNKIKAIRNAIGTGEVAADIAHNQLREEHLPDFPIRPGADEQISEFAPYFDIIEISDVYQNLIGKGGTTDA